ncbi:glycosytransferase [Clostridium perfringens]|uniref:Glycosytransferase n=1 Tax=Clostridium perfringens TaxID=1502 RepID=A0A2X3BTH0_CLOPF|nr:glycosyltransferase family 4 protein [Clostridium perfringens]SQC08428.1 glycosytransferase [Clostridium perfringens]
MKILVVANSSSGLFDFRGELLKKLVELDNEVYAVVPVNLKKSELQKIGINLIDLQIDRRGKNIFKEIKLLFEYYRNIKRLNPDITITYTIKPNIYCGIICRFMKKKYFANITGLGTAFYSGSILKQLIIYMYKLSFKKVNKVFFENSANKDIFIFNKIIDNENAVVLNGAGVDLEKFNYECIPNTKCTTFIFIGRIMKEKGIEEFLYSAEKIKKLNENVRFIILGNLEESYSEILNNMQNAGIIEYKGLVNDVKKYIKEAHCCILPSYHEGMSNTLLECGAMGRAIITSDIPGCREAVLDGKTGYLHKLKDKEDLIKKIKEYIDLSYEEKINMGNLSRKHIESIFDKRKIVKNTIENLLY